MQFEIICSNLSTSGGRNISTWQTLIKLKLDKRSERSREPKQTRKRSGINRPNGSAAAPLVSPRNQNKYSNSQPVSRACYARSTKTRTISGRKVGKIHTRGTRGWVFGSKAVTNRSRKNSRSSLRGLTESLSQRLG